MTPQPVTVSTIVPAERTPPVVVIPAYKPGPDLPHLVQELLVSNNIAAVVVVNDGSGPIYAPLFAELRTMPSVAVLDHAVNLGKGAALKTGLNHVACSFPDSVGVVTADADGQHAAADILKAAAGLSATPGALVLGARRFEGDVPLRSKFGNILTRYIMRAVTGQNITDTQTGLRGIPMDFIPELLYSKATGYDFELDMLVKCKYAGRQIDEVPIGTIYLENNRSSHFNPLLDSMRIYFVFIRFAAVSLLTATIDNLAFVIALRIIPAIWACMLTARLIAAIFNYTANKRNVFHSRAANAVALPKYWLSMLIAGVLSYCLIQGILAFTNMGVVSAKMSAETVMFFFSFVIQRDFVFSQRQSGETTP
jgi:putative flippase GtrA